MIDVLGVIQCRMSSTRLPGKAAMGLAGRTVLDWVCRRSLRCERIDRLVLATSAKASDDPVAEAGRGLGLEVVRGSESDVLARYVQAMDLHPSRAVVRITADNPLTDPATVDSQVDYFFDQELDYGYTARGPYGACADVFRADLLARAARVSNEPRHHEHINTFFLDNHLAFRLSSMPLPRPLQRPEVRVTLDTAQDLARLRAMFELLGDPLAAGLAEIIAAHDQLPSELMHAGWLDDFAPPIVNNRETRRTPLGPARD